MKIAFIDSGIDGNSFLDWEIEQYAIENNIPRKEKPQDPLGHGTSMMKVFSVTAVEKCSILSIRAGGDAAIENDVITADDLVNSILFAVEQGVSIINISMGIYKFHEVEKIQEACRFAAEKEILIVVASGNESPYTLPFCCAEVIKVCAGSGIKKRIILDNTKYPCPVFIVNKAFFYFKNSQDSQLFSFGNSACTAYVTSLIANSYRKIMADTNAYIIDREMLIRVFINDYVDSDDYTEKTVVGLFDRISIFKDKPSFLDKKVVTLKNCIIAPYSKEISAFFRFHELTKFNVIEVIDSNKKGNVGNDAYALNGISARKLTIKSRFTNESLASADSMIIGYVDKLSEVDPYFKIEHLLDIALKHELNVYSFLPIPQHYICAFNHWGLEVHMPVVIDEQKLAALKKYIPYLLKIQKPVIGVFGTSSKQGKFTLQLSLREALLRYCIRTDVLGTEHQSELLGIDFVFPYGYGAENNMLLNIDGMMEWLTRYMIYMDQFGNGDIMMVCGQSWLIPVNIERQSVIQNMAFLESTRPDIAVLVVNPLLDHKEYIRDTINCLQGIFKCKVIGLLFSDKTPRQEGNYIQTIQLDEEGICKIADSLYQEYNIKAGCITDINYIDKLAYTIINQLE